MKSIEEMKSSPRLLVVKEGFDGLMGYLHHPRYRHHAVAIIASWGGGWEHVSVSLSNRCPTWEEMCMVKDIFWGEDECVIQFHPPKSASLPAETVIREMEKGRQGASDRKTVRERLRDVFLSSSYR